MEALPIRQNHFILAHIFFYFILVQLCTFVDILIKDYRWIFRDCNWIILLFIDIFHGDIPFFAYIRLLAQLILRILLRCIVFIIWVLFHWLIAALLFWFVFLFKLFCFFIIFEVVINLFFPYTYALVVFKID